MLCCLPAKTHLSCLPSRSAKLRYLIKKEDTYEVETDLFEKFSYLLEIEKLGLKLWQKR